MANVKISSLQNWANFLYHQEHLCRAENYHHHQECDHDHYDLCYHTYPYAVVAKKILECKVRKKLENEFSAKFHF